MGSSMSLDYVSILVAGLPTDPVVGPLDVPSITTMS